MKEMVDTTDAVHGAGNLPFQRRGVQAKRDAPELYAPGEGDYEMLKGAVVGGGGAWASLVFCRKHQAGKTRICSQIPRREDVSKSRRVLGYDANALYPNAM